MNEETKRQPGEDLDADNPVKPVPTLDKKYPTYEEKMKDIIRSSLEINSFATGVLREIGVPEERHQSVQYLIRLREVINQSNSVLASDKKTQDWLKRWNQITEQLVDNTGQNMKKIGIQLDQMITETTGLVRASSIHPNIPKSASVFEKAAIAIILALGLAAAATSQDEVIKYFLDLLPKNQTEKPENENPKESTPLIKEDQSK